MKVSSIHRIQRAFVVLFGLIMCLGVSAEDAPDLRAFAETYWQAIQSKDAEKIFALYDPRVFAGLTDDDAELVKEHWLASAVGMAELPSDSYKIVARTLAPGELQGPWNWPVQPEYIVEIHLFRPDPPGKAGVGAVMDAVVQREGRYLIVRPLPPAEDLRKLREMIRVSQPPSPAARGGGFRLEALTIEAAKLAMKRAGGKADPIEKHTLVGAFYEKGQIVLDGRIDKETHRPEVNPYDLLNEFLAISHEQDFKKLEDCFSPSTRAAFAARLNDPEKGPPIRKIMAGVVSFEVVACWLEAPNQLIALTKSGPGALPAPQVLTFEEGRWFMKAGYHVKSDVFNLLGALYAAGKDNSAITIRPASAEERQSLVESGVGKLFDELRKRATP